ncbi:hypothetical protein NUH88_13260 [Nisaea acidiphila]|uniref:Lipocalin-like domain-containing protein n=1 Tax=Nisaea acidiphila TaxID=1862145 RepID=A0A9J7ASQ0_9PROT|nr:hypothetical protein [Nisaea acidiphila]UUX48381.1 hypothetical protein NUH88_13260 [Nisaea acidiphila]
MKKLLFLLMLCASLAACTSEEEEIDGRWVGTITPEARAELNIEGQLPNDKFVVVFEPGSISMNDTVRPAEYLPNTGRTLVHFKDENRALTVFHEEGADTIRLSAVSYYKNKVYRFVLRREEN